MALMLRRSFDPFPEISRLRDRMDRMFDESLRNFFERGDAEEPTTTATWYPTVDVFENDEEIRLRAELPGMREEDVEITLENGTLSLQGEKKFEEQEENGHYRRVESRYGRFVRQFPLPSSVDAEKIDARFKDGVLHIRLPKAEVAKPKRIAIKS